jgi:hypothetical protein
MDLNIVFSRKLLYNGKIYYYHISEITNGNFAKFKEYFSTMFSKASFKNNAGVGGLQLEQRFITADNYYIAFISTNSEPKELDDMIMSVGVSCWDDFPIYENRGITKNFNLDQTLLAEHKNLSLTLTSFTAYYMNAINSQLYNQGYLFIYAWRTMAAIIYKILKDENEWRAPKLYTLHNNDELLDLCSKIQKGEINGIKFDARTVLKKIDQPSELFLLKNNECPHFVAELADDADHPIWIKIDELLNLYKFQDVVKDEETDEAREKDKRQDEFKYKFQEMSPKQSFMARMISMVKPKKSTLGVKRKQPRKKRVSTFGGKIKQPRKKSKQTRKKR